MLRAGAWKKYSLVVIGVVLMTGHLCAQKLIDSIVTYYYPTERDSVSRNKIANEYNGAGQLASFSIYYRDTDTHRWEGWQFPCEECLYGYYGRREYTYDETGRLLSTSSFYWDYNQNKWALGNTGRREDGYDDRGNNVSIIYSSWNQATNEWDPSFGYEFGYDDAGNMISKITCDHTYPDNQTWHFLEKMVYAFDLQGRKTVEIRQLPDSTGRDWVNQVKTEWYYDSTGITTDYASFRWTLAGNNYEWHEEARHRIINQYDLAGNILLITESLKVSSTRWTPIMKEERAYNSTGQQVLSVISRGNGSLTEDFRSEWVYGPDGRLIQETLTGSQIRWPGGMAIKRRAKTIRSLDEDGNPSRVIWYYWDAQTKSYLFNNKDYYFYHSTSTSVHEPGIDHIRIYPNPTGGICYISGLSQPAEVKIYSMQGVLLRSMQNVQVSVDISDLYPGACLIIVNEAGHPPFRTMIIKE